MKKKRKFIIHSRKNVDDFWLNFWDWITVQRSALCRSRREFSNEYLLAKIGVAQRQIKLRADTWVSSLFFFYERDCSILLACLLASIQKRSSPVKFAHLAEKSGKGSISNLSTKAPRATPAAPPHPRHRSSSRRYAEPDADDRGWVSRQLASAHFGELVLGCIEAKFCK